MPTVHWQLPHLRYYLQHLHVLRVAFPEVRYQLPLELSSHPLDSGSQHLHVLLKLLPELQLLRLLFVLPF